MVHTEQEYEELKNRYNDAVDVNNALRSSLAAEAELARLLREEEAHRPTDLRALGWMVAVHNDYRQDGVRQTFWLLTKGNECVKGEGRSDADALDAIRAELRRRAGMGEK